jgi:Gpi18-like mannosyltransferase
MELAGKNTDRSAFILYVVMLLAAAWIVRLIVASSFTGFWSDQMLFVRWMEAVQQNGLSGAYASNGSINYPPFFLLLLGAYGDIANVFGISPQAGALSFKFILLLIDFAAILAAVKLTAGIKSINWRAFILLLFALNPALITDSAAWGQVDMLHSMLMVIAVLQLARRPWLSGTIFAVALLTKFQAVTVLPVIGVWLLVSLVRERRVKPLLYWALGFIAPWLVTAGYFGATGSLGRMISQAYTSAVGFFTSATLNAMNIWFYLIGVGPNTNDTETILPGLTMRNFGLLLLMAAVVFICIYVFVSRETSTSGILLKASAAVSFAFFMLPTEIHERYSIPALVFAIMAAMIDKRWIAAAGGLTVTVIFNLVIVLNNDVRPATGLWIAIMNAIILAGMLWELLREMRMAAQHEPMVSEMTRSG